MDLRDDMKAYGEWLCSIAPNSMVKSLTYGTIGTMYERDYVIVTNVCKGFGMLSEIPMSTIDGAKEYYKQLNKSLLETFWLTEVEKKDVSAKIDATAEELKQDWVNILRVRGIDITDR